MKKLTLFIPFFIISFCSLFAQGSSAANNMDGKRVLLESYDSVEGTAYLFSDWVKGDIYDREGEVFEDVSLNYNTLTNGFIAKVDEVRCIVLNKYNYKEIVIHDASGDRHFHNLGKYGDLKFYEAIYIGSDIEAYKKSKSVKLRNDIGNYTTADATYKYSTSEELFFLKNETLSKIKRNQKKILAFLKSKRLKSIIKKNQLNVKKDDGLAALLKEYDSVN